MSRKLADILPQKSAKKPLTFGQKCVIGGPNENDSHLDIEKDVKSNKKTKKSKEEVSDRSKSKKTDNSTVSDKPIKTGRVTPSGTNIPRSNKKRKKKKRK